MDGAAGKRLENGTAFRHAPYAKMAAKKKCFRNSKAAVAAVLPAIKASEKLFGKIAA
jgi:hypothetical protein